MFPVGHHVLFSNYLVSKEKEKGCLKVVVRSCGLMAHSGEILAILSECPESKRSVLLFSDKKTLVEKKLED